MTFLSILPTLLVGALALVMFGLGLSLVVDDFRRLLRHPKAVFLALGLQTVALPLACYFLLVALDVKPVFAIGLMLLAASPGGPMANLFSHLFGGNVAMNISLTAINTVLSIVTLPLITNLAIGAFSGGGQFVPLQFAKVAEIVSIVLIPVAIGMLVRGRYPGFGAHMEKPMKIFSTLVLVLIVTLAIAKEWSALQRSFASIGGVVIAFNLMSLMVGYYVPRWVGLDKPLATAIGYEIGIHNITLALYVALSVLQNFEMALPAAIYSISMYATATLFGFLVLRRK